MKEVLGYVITCTTDRNFLLFGVPDSVGDAESQNFETNGLQAFQTIGEARLVAERFLHSHRSLDRACATINVALIDLTIAENEADLTIFRERRARSFIVLYNFRGDIVNLLGVHGPTTKRDFDFGGRMTDKAKPFTDLNEALRLAGEAKRQGDAPTAVAHYSLRKLPKLHSTKPQRRRAA